ncbi:MAG: hypothetical protein INF43_04415 [Alphaproteobacteria bacterium]|nr:hypothetical protein [Alphaproteobacteria bacterium]
MRTVTLLACALLASATLSGCRYYGSAVPPENPISMGDALGAASNSRMGPGGQRGVVRVPTRPTVERPSYLPEKELALVAPPQTLLVWSYPHITDENTRVFGNWSTIFLTDRYEWAKPSTQLPQGQSDAGVQAGRPNLGFAETPPNPAATPPVLP